MTDLIERAAVDETAALECIADESQGSPVDTGNAPATPLEYALSYAARGWPTLPLCWPGMDGSCACPRRHTNQKDIGKAPVVGQGYHAASTEPEQIRAWWAQFPDANVGVALGKSGVVVVDQDSAAAELEAEVLGLPATMTVLTSKGRHSWYRASEDCPPERAIKQGASGGLDLLADGYVVAPPSVHQSGFVYRWLKGETGLPEEPGWVTEMLADALRKRGERPASGLMVATLDVGAPPPVPLSAQGLDIWEGRAFVPKDDDSVDPVNC